jgi:hypothetical protein
VAWGGGGTLKCFQQVGSTYSSRFLAPIIPFKMFINPIKNILSPPKNIHALKY